ncbi:hypothetical protein ACQJBY_002787 [Aegilops geniculata]
MTSAGVVVAADCAHPSQWTAPRRRRVGMWLLPSPSSVGGGAARASSSVLDHAAPMTPRSLLFPPPSPEHKFDDLVDRRDLHPYCCITPCPIP